MSDEFDKEAEREKLREKFADDEEKREHTQRMSELLLKGATMTNRHCDDCGDPVFRHDGREFCPTCGNEAGNAAGGGAVDTGAESPVDTDAKSPAGTDAEPPADTGAESPPGANPAAEGGADARDNGAVDAGAPADSESRSASPAAAPTRQSEPERSAPPQRSEPRRPESRRPDSQRSESHRPAPSRSADDAGGIDAARASLTRTLTRFARAAEETDDPRRARDHLEAAREAAEALAALD
ncbi:hypothetical protein EKH57_13715 [Halorubrum sp. BOL3-1]|uniref:Sjogren's syndrome/scleroderma autoantigen 1 family protein n=1 Tax=Halorubrum sp. BOL3-1 TaxID=2497325 RepID=UPI001004DDEA|nr:Sjogren's syndrome/scleroderma autoantigen 1 family protein [Halorubrum sp. BOL3-1]QAU13689.1 hypothetical protein EKH57_13715 [Halorubrum sp. BOL3-1]